MKGFRIGNILPRFLIGSSLGHPRKFLCSSTKSTNTNKVGAEATSVRDIDAYRQLDNLDFMTAAKILFTTPPKTKKFGLDFHLVQFFFCCMPAFAVYLVAQYARYEIKRMEAEAEVKKKAAEEEEKSKEMKILALEEEKKKNDPELLQVKVRLDALEEALKGISLQSNKPSSSSSKDQESQITHKDTTTVKSKSDVSTTALDDRGSSPKPGPAQKEQDLKKDSPAQDKERSKS